MEFSGPCIPILCNWPKSLVFDCDVTCTYHLFTESEVITGKSQTEGFSLEEYNKNTGTNFSHSLARAMALFVAHTKMFLYASFSFSY